MINTLEALRQENEMLRAKIYELTKDTYKNQYYIVACRGLNVNLSTSDILDYYGTRHSVYDFISDQSWRAGYKSFYICRQVERVTQTELQIGRLNK